MWSKSHNPKKFRRSLRPSIQVGPEDIRTLLATETDDDLRSLYEAQQRDRDLYGALKAEDVATMDTPDDPNYDRIEACRRRLEKMGFGRGTKES